MKNRVVFSLITASFMFLNGAFADDVKIDDVDIVESADDGYRAINSDISKTRTPILEIPQTINVITNKQIKDKKPQTLVEALEYVSGISYANSVGGIFDAVLKRGFGGNRDGSIMRNGISAGVTHNFNAGVESVEVLKGPASLLYGMQDPGGIINLVTKKPLYESKSEIYTGFGNNKYYNLGFDQTAPFGESGFAYRFIFDYLSKDYWREYGKNKSTFINPSISYQGDDYRLNFAYSHTKYEDPLDRGAYLISDPNQPNFNGKILPIDKKVRLDEPFNKVQGKIDTFDFSFEKNIGENWLLKSGYAFSRSIYDYGQMRVMNILDVAQGDATRRNEFYKDFVHQTQAATLDLNGIVNTGEISHNLLFGVNVGESKRERPNNNRDNGNTINIYNPKYGQIGTATTELKNSNQYEKTKTLGIYLQDNINLTESLILALGTRFEYYDQEGGKGEPLVLKTDQHGNKMLYQAGLLYLLTPEWSVYTNYAQSFKPQSSIAATTSSSLPPEEGEQVEFGTKFQNNNITATASIFNIDKKNVGYTKNVNGESTTFVSGKVRSKGFELDVSGKVVGGLSLSSSYTYTKTKTLKDDDTPWKVGKAFEATPKHQATLFANYDFSHLGLNGFRLGGGAKYFGSWFAYAYTQGNTGEAFKIPHAVTYDAFASYTTKISGYETNFALNIKNITDKLYYTSAATGTQAENVIPIQPGYTRQIMLTASVKF